MRQYCLTIELKNDEELIREYEKFHQQENIWPEIIESIRSTGVHSMSIYRFGVILVMVLIVEDSFSFKDKAERDKNNKYVQDWERLMAKFQKVKLDTSLESKWELVDPFFELS